MKKTPDEVREPATAEYRVKPKGVRGKYAPKFAEGFDIVVLPAERPERPQTKPELLADWFFRLNGCATIQNFVLHPNLAGSQRTDVDLIAVRFPYRNELAQS